MIAKLIYYFSGSLVRRLVIALPLGWLLLFFLTPFFVVIKISLSEPVMASPPFLPLFTNVDGELQFSASLDNYLFVIQDGLYLQGFLSSIKIAGVSTLLTLLLGYPLALYIARSQPPMRYVLLLLVFLPFLTPFLLRIYAWIGFLKNNGLFNNLLQTVGLIDEPLVILQTDIAVYIGIVYVYLPFMVMPIYVNLVNLHAELHEASSDLGASPFATFVYVTLPLSKPGIIAGSLLVFIPAVGEFVIPSLLGGADTLMSGHLIWLEFFGNRDWPVASAVSVLMLGFVAVPLLYFYRLQQQRT